MTKKFLFLLFALAPSALWADEVPAILITKADGTNISVAISELREIKFDAGKMVLNKRDDSQVAVNVDDITVVSFSSIASAIESLCSDDADEYITITDTTGKIVYQGKSNSSDIPSNLHGVYIIKTAKRIHKVAI